MKKYLLGIVIILVIASAVFLFFRITVKKRGVEIEIKKTKEIKKLRREVGKTLEEKVDELKKKSAETMRKKKDGMKAETKKEIGDVTEEDREKLEEIIEKAQE